MKYSIIVPIYKVEQFLRECITSVINQTYKNWELILVDDGSPDNCPTICDEYACTDERIKVIHKPNGGLVSARKAGLEIATGDYVWCLDGDDQLELNGLTVVEENISEIKPDVICFGYSIYYTSEISRKKEIKGVEYGYYSRDRMEKSIFPLLMYEEKPHTIGPNIWSKIFKTEIYRYYQTKVDSSISMGEDGACIYPLLTNAQSLLILPECLYLYRCNPTSMTKTKKALSWTNFEKVYQLYEDEIKLDELDMRMQFYQSRVHNLFIIACSRFHSKDDYKTIINDIGNHLDKPTNNLVIDKVVFSTCRMKLAHFALKHKCFFLIKFFSYIH